MFSIRNVLLRFGVVVLLGEPKINNMYEFTASLVVKRADQEVLGFHISVDHVLAVNVLKSIDLVTAKKKRRQLKRSWLSVKSNQKTKKEELENGKMGRDTGMWM